jgi:zinc protease
MMTRRSFLTALAATATYPASDRAATSVTDGGRVEVTTLTNGARCVALYEPGAPLMALGGVFSAGVADEIAGEGGLTSLLARSWLSSTEDRTVGLLAYDVSAIGGDLATLATGDRVEISAICRGEGAAVTAAAQTLFLSYVAAPAFDDDAVRRAQAEQLRDIELSRDDAVSETLAALRRRVWQGAPPGRDPLGEPAAVRAATPETVRRHYARLFQQPERAVFVVAGNIRPADAFRLVESNLNAGGWPDRLRTDGGKPLPPRRPAPHEWQSIPPDLRDGDTGRRVPAPILAVGFLAPGTAGKPSSAADHAALLVLDALAAGGKGSRLFALRDRPAAGVPPIGYDVRSLIEPGRAQTLWAAYVLGCARPFAEVKTALLATLRSLADGTRPATDAELARAKAYLKGRHLRERARIRDRAFGAAVAEVRGLGAAFDAAFDARIDAVTPADVSRLARTVFGGNCAVVHTTV